MRGDWRQRSHFANVADAIAHVKKEGATHRGVPYFYGPRDEPDYGPPFYVFRQVAGEWQADHVWGFPDKVTVDNEWLHVDLTEKTESGEQLWRMIPLEGTGEHP